MSQTTKRKYVTSEVLNKYILPDENQTIVKIISTKGNNLHMVTSCDGVTFLVSMPQKFRKNVWIKRGDYVVVESIAEGDRVKGEIVAILYKDQIRHIKTHGQWPFSDEDNQQSKGDKLIPDDMLPPSESDDSDLENPATVVNPNRPNICVVSSEDSDSDVCEGESSKR